MTKNENGITIVSLVVTVVVLFILIGVAFSIGFYEIDDARNNKLWEELGIVRQAVVEQYQKALALGKTGELKSAPQLDIWIGRKINDKKGNDFFPGAINDELEKQGITDAYMFTYNYNDEKCVYQEDCCYELNSTSLKQLGIEDATHEYIVNYKTGEVYNKTKQVDFEGKLLYLIPVNYGNQMLTLDTQNFNDWPDGFED